MYLIRLKLDRRGSNTTRRDLVDYSRIDYYQEQCVYHIFWVRRVYEDYISMEVMLRADTDIRKSALLHHLLKIRAISPQ